MTFDWNVGNQKLNVRIAIAPIPSPIWFPGPSNNPSDSLESIPMSFENKIENFTEYYFEFSCVNIAENHDFGWKLYLEVASQVEGGTRV